MATANVSAVAQAAGQFSPICEEVVEQLGNAGCFWASCYVIPNNAACSSSVQWKHQPSSGLAHALQQLLSSQLECNKWPQMEQQQAQEPEPCSQPFACCHLFRHTRSLSSVGENCISLYVCYIICNTYINALSGIVFTYSSRVLKSYVVFNDLVRLLGLQPTVDCLKRCKSKNQKL